MNPARRVFVPLAKPKTRKKGRSLPVLVVARLGGLPPSANLAYPGNTPPARGSWLHFRRRPRPGKLHGAGDEGREVGGELWHVQVCCCSVPPLLGHVHVI